MAIVEEGWRLVRPKPGQALREPAALFTKLDPAVAEEEEERLAS